MTQKNRNSVITKLNAVLAQIAPFNRAFQYGMKIRLLNEVIYRLDSCYSDNNITDKRIEFVIGNVIYEKIMA